jgi:hypothetical protein
LIRSLPVRSASGLPVYVAAAQAAPFSTALRYARNDRTRDWNGNAYCAREKLANTTQLIFMAEPYPCYPFDPWFVRDFETIG